MAPFQVTSAEVATFDTRFLDNLSARAAECERLRQHYNVHVSYDDPCQRFFNAVEPGTYIPPHRHTNTGRRELLVAVRGSLAAVFFDCDGHVVGVQRLGTGRDVAGDVAVAVETSPSTWHTVLSLAHGSVLLEVKAGPFDPAQAHELAPWAPREGTEDAEAYRAQLEALVRSHIGTDRSR